MSVPVSDVTENSNNCNNEDDSNIRQSPEPNHQSTETQVNVNPEVLSADSEYATRNNYKYYKKSKRYRNKLFKRKLREYVEQYEITQLSQSTQSDVEYTMNRYVNRFGNNNYFHRFYHPFGNNKLYTDDFDFSDDIIVIDDIPQPQSNQRNSSFQIKLEKQNSEVTHDTVSADRINHCDDTIVQNGIIVQLKSENATDNLNKNNSDVHVLNIQEQEGCLNEIGVKLQDAHEEEHCLNELFNFEELTNEEKTNPLIVCIVNNGYPNIKSMSNWHLQALDKTIQTKIDKLKIGKWIPRFEYSYNKNKAIVIKCADKLSQKWLRQNLRKIKPWPSAQLTLTSTNIIGKAIFTHIVGRSSLYLANEESAITVLSRLQKQNPEVNIGSWQIHSEKIIRKEYNGFLIKFGIPESSFETLKNMGFKLFYGMSQIQLNVKLMNKDSPLNFHQELQASEVPLQVIGSTSDNETFLV